MMIVCVCRYNNMNAMLLFIPAMLVFGEVGAVVSSPVVWSAHFWAMMTTAGIFGAYC